MDAEQLLNDELTDRLLAYDEMQAIHYLPHSPLPLNTDLLVQDCLNSLDDYFGSPYCVDSFSDHSERENWRYSLPEDEFEFLQTNALRKGLSSMLTISLTSIGRQLDDVRFRDLATQIGEQMHTSYDQLSIEERFNYLIRVREDVQELANSALGPSV